MRVGVIGLGYGLDVIAPLIQANNDFDLVGICGTSSSGYMRVKNKHLNFSSLVFSGVDSLLAQNLDLVCLAVPPSKNEQLLNKVLQYNSSFFCEKPLAHNYEASKRIFKNTNANKVQSAIGYQFSQITAFRRIKELAVTEEFGKFVEIDITWQTLSYVQKTSTWSWKTEQSEGGGVLNLLGSHIYYLLYWIFGGISDVNANFSYEKTLKFCPPGCDAGEDTITAFIQTEKSLPIKLKISNASNEKTLHRWVIHTEKGVLLLENYSNEYMRGFKLTYHPSFNLNSNGGKLIHLDNSSSSIDSRSSPLKKLLKGLANNILAGHKREEVPSLFDGYYVQRMIEASRLSDKSGRAIKIASIY
jgi:predicted dehydrogenase